MSARILILTNGPLARNPRVVKEATALGAAGYSVTVLGVRNHAASVPLDAELAVGAPFTHRWIDLLSGPQAWIRRAAVRLARDAAHRLRLPSIHSLGPASALLRVARAQPADLVIVHNEIAHWAGVRLLGEGRRVAADFEDWHSEDLLPADRAGRPIALIRRVEHTLLHRAAYVTTTSEALATGLHARHGGHRPAVITNSFPLQSNPRTLDPFDSNAPRSFLWFSQTTGPGRGLEFFLAAWARVSRPSKVVLIGEVCAGYDRHLLSLLPEGLRHRLSFLPPVSPGALPGVIAGHDIGLALELNEPENKNLTASNKIFQYLGAGLAVVASDTAGQSEVLARDPNAGILVSLHDTAAFSARLEDLLADPAALRARQFAARRLAESRYCWEHESLRLLESVKRALS